MIHSLYLLAACLVSAGEPAPLPVGPAQPVYSAPASYPTSAPVYTYQTQESKPSFLSRLKSKFSGLFNKKQSGTPWPCQNQGVPVSAPVYQSEPPVVEQPTLQQTAYPLVPLPQPVQEEGSSEEQSEGTNQAGQEINKKFIGKVGHEDDYSWVTGQLYNVRTGDGAVWVVRYATVDTEDRYGGSIVVAPAVNMKNFREGDLVSVKGEIINESRANKHLAGPLYRVVSIDMIERAD